MKYTLCYKKCSIHELSELEKQLFSRDFRLSLAKRLEKLLDRENTAIIE